MKKIITLLFLAFFVVSCSKTDDDTGNNCTSDCTTISGKFISANNAPVPNVRLKLQYRIGGSPFGEEKREK